ncbi:MAG TPA: efflux RND transporter permease subunit [Candidatus Acidoferrales bacterium]|nr:efflux RND transporter permease subunit [Candidatus Acidoferrales bacterium]
MSITEPFVRRPVMTTLVSLAFLLFGLLAYLQLPVSDLPNVDFPTILVSARLPGASPDTMASAVAMPLERQFTTIAGLDNMSSSNSMGLTQITLQFVLERNIDAAAQDVQTAISQTMSQLPQNIPSPPTYYKVNPAGAPILYLSMVSATLPLSTVDEFGETFIAQRISMVNGVAQVQVYGGQKYAVRVQVDPKALASRGIGIDEIAAAVQNANVDLPTGALWGSHESLTVQSNGQLFSAAEYKPMIVAYRDGRPVRLQEVGRVIDSVENDKVASWFCDKTGQRRSVSLAILKQPGANTIEVVDGIKRLLDQMRPQIPPAIEIKMLSDESLYIRESVNDVKFTLLLTVFLVVLVIFLFLRNLSATIIPSLALPMSILGTFAVMYLLGYTLDTLSLMALTLSVGFVVDDAIVMLENIVRHLEMGKGKLEAALAGSREIGFTILSMTISLAAVFIPVLFMGGIVGRLLHEFAVTIGAAILVSGFVSLTLTPMLSSRFLRPQKEQRHGWVYRQTERFFDAMLRGYDATLQMALRHRPATMLLFFAMLAGSAWLFRYIPKGFLPSEDTGEIYLFAEAAQGISFDSMMEHQHELADIVRTDPDVRIANSNIGASGSSNALNTGRMFIDLVPRRDRRASVDDKIEELRPKIAAVPGIRAFLQNLPRISLGGRITKSLYQITLQSPDTRELYPAAQEFEKRLHALKEIEDVTSDLQMANPQLQVQVDRDKAASLGVSATQVEDALYSAYGARQISTIYAPNNQYRVILELVPEFQRDSSALSLLYVRSTNGQLVPIDSVAHMSRDLGPTTVNHSGQLPSVTVSFNLSPGFALSQAVDAVNRVARDALPAAITTNFQGTAQAFEKSFRGLGVLLVLSILVIYLVLGVLYESFIHPLTILSGLPSAAFGALVTLILFKTDLNIYSFVGVIMLVGIVKKNAIMMIDFALDAQRRQGKPPLEAIYQGCLIRFRPIMMTTMAALMGTLPIALGIGAGAEARRPLGLAVVGGLVISQFVTLYLTPVFYLYMDSFQHWLRPAPAVAAGGIGSPVRHPGAAD